MADEETWQVEEDETWENLSTSEKEEARELLKAIMEVEKNEPPSSTASEPAAPNEKLREEVLAILELQSQRLDQIAKLNEEEAQARRQEWEAARLVIADMKEAMELQAEYIEKLDSAVSDLGLATQALVKATSQLAQKK